MGPLFIPTNNSSSTASSPRRPSSSTSHTPPVHHLHQGEPSNLISSSKHNSQMVMTTSPFLLSPAQIIPSLQNPYSQIEDQHQPTSLQFQQFQHQIQPCHDHLQQHHQPHHNNKRQSNHPSSFSSSCGGGGGIIVDERQFLNGDQHPPPFNKCCVPNPLTNSSSTSNLRKYIVLLQDCIAIKFISTTGLDSSDPFNFTNVNNDSAAATVTAAAILQTIVNHQQHQNNGQSGSGTINGGVGPAGTSGNAAASVPSLTSSDVDHSLHGMQLYKSFREANLKCHWNLSLTECIRSLEYKGYLVPSTILIYSASPRHMNVLRTAWSRRILRYPPGYRIELMGEIEEVVAQPVQQGQFAPLSDSLCWAILELTSRGQEAFVDSIMLALSTAFPSMSIPPKEYVFQTLEKLIKEQKIYQTSHGYYIVTQEVSTFMNSRSATPAPRQYAVEALFGEHDKFSQQSWGSAASVLDAEELLLSRRNGFNHGHTLKRHNSLKIIRQRDRESGDVIPRPCMGARSLSFRLSKVNSLFDSDKDDEEEEEERRNRIFKKEVATSTENSEQIQTLLHAQMNGGSGGVNGNLPEVKIENGQKKRSFFRRWFSFRRQKLNKPLPQQQQHRQNLSQSAPQAKSTSSSGTQTASASPPVSSTAHSKSNENILNHVINLPSSSSSSSAGSSSKWNSLPSQNRHVRRSLLSEDSPFYDDLVKPPRSRSRTVLYPPSSISEQARPLPHHPKMGSQPAYPPPASSSRRRHISGGNGVPRSASPCPSSVSAIYASIPVNTSSSERVYPRVFQHYSKFAQQQQQQQSHAQSGPPPVRTRHHQTHRARPRSAYEIYAFQKDQTSHSHSTTKSTTTSTTTSTRLRSSSSSKTSSTLSSSLSSAAAAPNGKNIKTEKTKAADDLQTTELSSSPDQLIPINIAEVNDASKKVDYISSKGIPGKTKLNGVVAPALVGVTTSNHIININKKNINGRVPEKIIADNNTDNHQNSSSGPSALLVVGTTTVAAAGSSDDNANEDDRDSNRGSSDVSH